MINVLLVLSQITAIFFLLASSYLLLMYNTNKKRTIKLLGRGLLLWALAVFFNIFGLVGADEINVFFYALFRLVIAFSFILLIFHGILAIFVPMNHAKFFAIIYFVVALVLDFTINDIESMSILRNMGFHNIYIVIPVSLLLFFYYYSRFTKLKEPVVAEVAMEWGLLFVLNLLITIFSIMNFVFFTKLLLFFECCTIILLAFSFDRLRRKEDIWDEVTELKPYVLDYNLIVSMNKVTHKETRPLIDKLLLKYGVKNFSDLKRLNQKELFITELFKSNFTELPPKRRFVLETKVIEALDLNPEHWRETELL